MKEDPLRKGCQMSKEEVVEIIEKVEEIDLIGESGFEVAFVEETVAEIETGEESKEAVISVELFDDAKHLRKHLRVARTALLLEVLDEGARKLDVKLLPNPQQPLDLLRGVYRDHETGGPLNLDLTLAEFLRREPVTHHFAVELVLAIQINTRWRVAPQQEMTPRTILELAGLSPAEYSLYYPCDSVDPLPPDIPIKLHRGQRFEAQRDGKYGEEDSGEHCEG
jgi:hypothetical protein